MLLIKNHVKASGKGKYGHLIMQYRAIHQLYCAFYWAWLLSFDCAFYWVWMLSFDSYLLISDLGE